MLCVFVCCCVLLCACSFLFALIWFGVRVFAFVSSSSFAFCVFVCCDRIVFNKCVFVCVRSCFCVFGLFVFVVACA